MSFLSIAFLAALPLAAAPLLLHFFDRRRNVVIEWGAMQFLEEAATRRTSARRLKEWLLLLMRIAALLALILALARPLAPGNWLGANDRAETIIIIDNSMSLMRAWNEKPLFDELIIRATETINDLSSGDLVRVMLASPYPEWVTVGSVRITEASRSRLTKQLVDLRTTGGSSDLPASLFTAVQADADATIQRRRIVLLTDGQGADWRLDDKSRWARFQDLLSAATVATELEVIELDQPSAVGNLALNEIHANRTIVGVNQPVIMTAQIKNHDDGSSAAGKLHWAVDGKKMEDRHLPAIDGNGSRDVVWKHSFAETGVFAVSCRAEADDDLEADNAATVVVEVVERIPILLIEGAGQLAEMQRDAFFVQAALGRIEGEEDTANWQAVFEPHTVTPARLETIDFEQYRAVVIPNLTEPSEKAVSRLHEFVAAGGGLWLALGPRTDVDEFNHYFFADGDGLAPLSISAMIEDSDTDREKPRTKVNPYGKEHPAVAALTDIERLDAADVKVTGRFRFNTGISYDDVSVLLDLTNGEPLAVEKYVGRGRVIVQSIPLRYQWSDFALKQSFVVMVHDWLAYLAQPRATRHNLAPGDPISIHLANSQLTEATLTTPHGDEIGLAADPMGDGVVFRSSRTILPGRYTLEFGLSGDRVPFYVTRDPRESNLAAIDAAGRKLFSEASGIGQSSISQQFAAANQRDPVWPLLLIGLIGLLAGELLLAGLIARQRFGSDSIAETTEDWMQQADNVAMYRRQPVNVQPQGKPGQAGKMEREIVNV